mmetsp:Transcript_24548/g.48158  ORF Transcript_24548/g.48158 Transcript_24548/m.48158 type:complete len:105 (+) Transcript_24548:992-1306(+)
MYSNTIGCDDPTKHVLIFLPLSPPPTPKLIEKEEESRVRVPLPLRRLSARKNLCPLCADDGREREKEDDEEHEGTMKVKTNENGIQIHHIALIERDLSVSVCFV